MRHDVFDIPKGYMTTLGWTEMVLVDRHGRRAASIKIFMRDKMPVEYQEYFPSGKRGEFWSGTLDAFNLRLQEIKHGNARKNRT